MKKNRVLKNILMLMCVISTLLSVASFAYRNQQSLYLTPIDFLVFLRAGQVYKENGQLYQRAGNYTDKYHPSASIFKFPPAFQLMFLPLNQFQGNVKLHIYTRLILTLFYITSIALLFTHLKIRLGLNKDQTTYFLMIFTIISS